MKLRSVTLFVLAAWSVWGCSNTVNMFEQKLLPSQENVSGPAYTISRVSVDESGAGSNGAGTAQIIFDGARLPTPLTEICKIGPASGAPCVCEFNWVTWNTSENPPVSVARSDFTQIFEVQRGSVRCSMPQAFAEEDPSASSVEVSVKPATGNPNQFFVARFNLSASEEAAASGDFQDFEGRSFANIFRYACYEQVKKVLKLGNRSSQATSQDGSQTRDVRFSSAFCTQGGGNSCAGMPQASNSAQSYYYNLFVRSTDRGSVNRENLRFKCPLVQETLESIVNPGSQTSDFWPMDSSFALALTASSDFPVGVEAYSKLGSAGDPNSQNSSCFGTSSSPSDDSSLVRSCLGFAAKPRMDGSCPAIRGADGTNIPTYRLRRYVAMYPPHFDNGGKMLSQGYSLDTVYVIDRPVNESAENPSGAFTMKGPKPCPFAYYDRSNVIGNGRSYYSTNDRRWNGCNVDGIQFPNFDREYGSQSSCAATMALPGPNFDSFGLVTIHSTFQNPNPENPIDSTDPNSQPCMNYNADTGQWERGFNKVHVRPVSSWSAHYEEDTSFQACSPLSNPLIDPPLHIVHKSEGHQAYCAEVYPTKNPYVTATAKKESFYTSHLKNNSLPSSVTCTRTLTENTPGTSHDPERCDRTVRTPSIDWYEFPLLAPEADVERALRNDPEFECRVTFDAGGTKAGKQSPSGGCCGSSVTMNPSIEGQDTAHLEPVAACATPTH